MSCQACDQFQETGNKVYYRWKNANVEINACKEHFLEIVEVLNVNQFPKQNENTRLDDLVEADSYDEHGMPK